MHPRGIWTLLVAAAVVAVSLSACSSSSVQGRGIAIVAPSPHRSSSTPDFPSTTASSSTVAPQSPQATRNPLPGPAQRVAALQRQVPGERIDAVVVPGGYEAATYDQAGHIDFWHNDQQSASWTVVGRSRYPFAPQLGPPHASVHGARLNGMQHATFIVRGVFTGDGSGNAVAFTSGANGWGAIKAEPNGNIGPSGDPVGSDEIGLSYNFGFAGGQLVTEDCPTNRPIAECGSHAIVKRWAWTGSDFALA